MDLPEQDASRKHERELQRLLNTYKSFVEEPDLSEVLGDEDKRSKSFFNLKSSKN